jgi:anti-sigma factor RsiW
MKDMHQPIVARLSEFVDGELDHAARHDVEAHLRTCEQCREVADDLRTIKRRAAALPAVPPQNDLWDGIASRLAASPQRVVHFTPRRRFSFTLPQIAAACIALMVLSGGMVWLARSGDPRADFPVASGADAPAVAPVRLIDSQYEGAVEDLERILEEGRSRLDPETVRVLEQNLTSIDAAIEQCRQALDRDPANAYLNSHLAAARARKLALLRRATALTAGS